MRDFKSAPRAPWHLAAALVLMGLLVPALSAAEERGRLVAKELWQFDSAETAPSEPGKRPPEDANWKPVSLPDAWSKSYPGHRGTIWYRMKFELTEIPSSPYAVYVPNRRSWGLVFMVNGARAGDDILRGAQLGAWYSPQFYLVPPAMLRKGTNLLEFRMNGDAALWAGLGRVSFGDQHPVRLMFRSQNNIENGYQIAQMVTLFVLGVVALAMWRVRRADRVAFWFALACLTWALSFAARLGLLGIPLGPWGQVTAFFVYALTPVFTVVICLRVAERRSWMIEGLLWASFFSAVAWILFKPGETSWFVWTVLPNAYTILVAVAAAWLLVLHRRSLGWSLYLFVAAVALSLAFPLHDILRDAGILDLDRPSLRHFQTIDLVIGIGAMMLERHLAGTRAIESMNIELTRRVAEKTAEIEEGARRMQAMREEQMLAKERARMLADMHDGVGASLVSLTHMVRDPAVQREELARRAGDALQDLRMAIDSLEPFEGDLAAVLANMRTRIGEFLKSANLRLEWAVNDLPPVHRLTPSMVLDVQRVVYEAVTNAVRHARARSLKISAAGTTGAVIRISVEDDGIGFDPASAAGGRGMVNLRRRAQRLSAPLDVRSGPAGTSVALELPIGEPAAAPASAPPSPPSLVMQQT